MKKTILIGALIVIVITTVFSYALQEGSFSQTSPVQSNVASTTGATFRVGDTAYPIDVMPGETVIGAMHSLASTSDFTFTAREYPGLGEYVDSINGQKNGGGMYWMLYLNGTTTTSGASATTIKAGDSVEWRYEKGY